MVDTKRVKRSVNWLIGQGRFTSQKEIGERLGITNRSYLSQLVNSDTPNEEFVNKFTEIAPEISRDWLLTGEGEMLVEGKDKGGGLSLSDETRMLNKVPLIPASAFAGGISGFAPDSIMLKDCERITPPVDGAQCAITITGDSMEPDFHNGSIAFLRLINESAFIPWGHVMVIDTENGAFIKTIYPDIDDEAYIWAKSINPKYPPIHIPKASIFRIFRVLGTSRIFTTM